MGGDIMNEGKAGLFGAWEGGGGTVQGQVLFAPFHVSFDVFVQIKETTREVLRPGLGEDSNNGCNRFLYHCRPACFSAANLRYPEDTKSSTWN